MQEQASGCPGPADLACLEPNLKVVIIAKGTILCKADDPIRYTYFAHDAIVGLINVMEDGQFVEVAPFGGRGCSA